MTRSPLPPILYLIMRDFGPGYGIGSPDVADNHDTAYDLFSCAVEDAQPVAVWVIATKAGLPVGIRDTTDAFEREMQEVCVERDLDWPTVRRIEDAPVFPLMAAE